MSIIKNAAFLAAIGASFISAANENDSVPGEMIVKFKSELSRALQVNILAPLGAKLDRKILKDNNLLFVIKFDQNKKNMKTLTIKLLGDKNIEYAEPNYIYSIVNPAKSSLRDFIPGIYESKKVNYTPEDPQFSALWGLHNTGENPGTANGVTGADIDVMRAWAISQGNRNVKIAVIDTGIDYNHPDLQDQMWVNLAERDGKAGVDDDGNGYVDDIHGYDFANNDGDPLDGHSHGTHCAGTIGASHNDIGVTGVMRNVQFVAVKFLTDRGSGSSENAIKAIDYATKLNVDIMSNSWGGGGFSMALKEAIQRASDAGIIFTAAAGNSSTNNDQKPHYPSSYDVPNVVSVAASTASDGLASFSSYGKASVHIAAPGHKILSTVKNGGYAFYSGTSMATPHVSGGLGLLLSHGGRMSHASMRERLMATSDPVRVLRSKIISGGRLNAYNLLTDTRPERNEPRPGEWETLQLEEAFESEHPYQNNENFQRSFSVQGAKFMRVRIKKYDTEKRYDVIKIQDASGSTIESISGRGSDYLSDHVEGDFLVVRFSSDRSSTMWGFVISELEVQY